MTNRKLICCNLCGTLAFLPESQALGAMLGSVAGDCVIMRDAVTIAGRVCGGEMVVIGYVQVSEYKKRP